MAKSTAEYILRKEKTPLVTQQHKKARTCTEDEADGRLQDPFHGEDKHPDKNPAIIQVHRESKSRGFTSRCKLLMSLENRRAGAEFAKIIHLKKPGPLWNSILWIDEGNIITRRTRGKQA